MPVLHHLIKTCSAGLFLACLCSTSLSPLANEAKPLAANPALEAQMHQIAVELRCLVCQNETIAGSNAELAVDLKAQIRDQLQGGQSKDQILAYMVERYGDFVLYNPPVKVSTYILWFGPFLLLGFALWTLRRHIQTGQNAPHDSTLSPADVLRARKLLDLTQKDLK